MTLERSAVIMVGVALALAFGAPLWTACLDTDPYALVSAPNQPATFAHWLGTDGVGRDVLARILYGARTSIALAVGAAVLAGVVGGGLGGLAGFFGGAFDEVVARATEAAITVPKLPLLLLLASMSSPEGATVRAVFVVVLLAGLAWPGPAR
ncbi:MAG: ABC transporter permease, partial [Myxococcota bacterium]